MAVAIEGYMRGSALFSLASLLVFSTWLFLESPARAVGPERNLYHQRCREWFEFLPVRNVSDTLGVSPGAVIRARSVPYLIPDEEMAFLETLNLKIGQAQGFYNRLSQVERGRAGRSVRDQVTGRLQKEAKSALLANYILEHGSPSAKQIVILENGLIKRIDDLRGIPYTASMIDRVQEHFARLLAQEKVGKLFFQNYKSIQFTTSLTNRELNEKVLGPMREFLIKELLKDPVIVNAFGGPAGIRTAVNNRFVAGLGYTHVEASLQAKMAVLDRGKVHLFSKKRFSRVLERARELESRIPSIFMNTGGRLKEEVIRAFRRAKGPDFKSIRKKLPLEMRGLFDERTKILIEEYLLTANVSDYRAPSPMPPAIALEISDLLSSDVRVSSENLTQAVALYKKNQTGVLRQVLASLKGKTRLILLLDHVGLGLNNYSQMRSKIPDLISLLSDDRNAKRLRLPIDARGAIRDILIDSEMRVRKNFKSVEEVLKSEGVRYRLIPSQGDEFYISLDRYHRVAGKLIRKLLDATEGVRVSGMIMKSGGRPEEALLQLNHQMNIIKEFEDQGMQDVFALGVNGHTILVPPPGVDQKIFEKVVDSSRWLVR